MSTPCTLCPRNCRVDRAGTAGYCGMGQNARVARAALHFWEEPCISGVRGSGTVFFSGCTLRCAYCQNHEISHLRQGKDVTAAHLAGLFKNLAEQGAHNVNLVTGTQFVPVILEALSIYKPPVPVVWNSGGYEKIETLRLLEGAVDIYLPDFKHLAPRLSALCAGAPDYGEVAGAAIAEMLRQAGPPVYDADGMMRKGVLIRHLILPGCTGDSMNILSFIAEHFPGVPVSLMRQYTPEPWCHIPGLNRRITDKEYQRVLARFQALGLEGYLQEEESADAHYTPAFDLTGV